MGEPPSTSRTTNQHPTQRTHLDKGVQTHRRLPHPFITDLRPSNMERSKATIRNPGHVLAPKIGDDSMHDEALKKKAMFESGEANNASVAASAKEVDAATLEMLSANK